MADFGDDRLLLPLRAEVRQKSITADLGAEITGAPTPNFDLNSKIQTSCWKLQMHIVTRARNERAPPEPSIRVEC